MMKARQACRAVILAFLFCIENADIQGFRIKNPKELKNLKELCSSLLRHDNFLPTPNYILNQIPNIIQINLQFQILFR